jgi:hypothetical protein
MHEIECFVLIDENGDYAIATEQSCLMEAYNDNIGGDLRELASRIIAVKLTVPTPTVITVAATLPAQNDKATVTVS